MDKELSIKRQIEYNRLYRAKNKLVVALISKENKERIIKNGKGKTINDKLTNIIDHFLGKF